jgi:ABC-2 type transport system permease protein
MMLLNSTYNEFLKIAARPRSYISLLAVSILVGVILFALKSDGLSYISILTTSFEQTLTFNGDILNGSLVAFIVLQMLIIHIPLLIALVTGDMVSGEAAMGTLRMLGTKPISRTNLLLSKFIAGNIYTLIILIWLAIMSLGAGKLLFGNGDLMVLNSDGLVILQEADISWRFLGSFMVAYLSLVTVATLSTTLSCFTDNSIGPIVVTMSIIILFTIINTLDVQVFDSVRPFLFTTHMASWRSFFEEPLPKTDILNSILILFAHIGILMGTAFYKFSKKDILS